MLSEGSNTIYIRVFDGVGHEDATGDQIIITKDVSPPMITINQAYYGWYTTDPGAVIDVDFSNGGTGSLLDYAQYKVGSGGTWTNIFTSDVVSYNTDWAITWSDLVEGNNTIYIRVFDVAAQEDASMDMIWVLKDDGYPVVTINTPSYGWYTTDPGAVIDVDFSNGGFGSPLDYAQYRIGIGGTWTDIFTTNTPSYTTNWAISWSDLSEGLNTIYIRVFDIVSHEDITSDSITLQKDTIAPNNNLAEIIIEMGDSYICDTTLDFTWAGFADPGGSGIEGYYYSFTDGSETTTGTWDSTSPGQLLGAIEGTVTIFVWAKDIVGNIGQASSDTIIVDLSGPSPGTVSIENDAAYANKLVLDFEWSGFVDSFTFIEGYYYSVSDGSGTQSGQWTTAPYAQIMAPGNGTFTLFVWAKDVVGNIGLAASDEIFVQLPSALDLRVPTLAYRGYPVSITANATDSVQAEGSLTCLMEYRPPSGTWTILASTYIGTSPSGHWRTLFTPGINYELGTYEFRVRFSNGESITTSWLYNSTFVLNNLPKIQFTSQPTAPEDNELVLQLGDSESDVEDTRPSLLWFVEQFDEEVIESLNGEQSSDDTLHFEPAENYFGTTMVLLRLVDSDGGYALIWVNLTWTPVNDPPVLVNPILDLSIPEDGSDTTSVDLTSVFYDPDDDTLNYEVSGNVHIVITIGSDGKVTFTPALDWIGLESITFTASDKELLFANDEVDIDVYEANDDPPTFTPLPDLTLLEDTILAHPFDLNDYFNDIDTQSLTFSVGELVHLQITIHPNGSVTVTPQPNWFGSEEVMFSALDGTNSPVIDTVTITVTPVNDPPVAFIDSMGPGTITQGTEGTLLGHGEDIEGGALRYLWTSDRDGNVGTSITLTLSGISVGDHIITFMVQDDGGLWSEGVSIELTVIEKDEIIDTHDIDEDGIPDSQDTDMDGDGIPNHQDTDGDGDGLPDSWEQMHGLSALNPYDAALDPDNDGYSNSEEYQAGSDPNNGDVTPETISKEHSTDSSGFFNSMLIVLALIILIVIMIAIVVLKGKKSKKPTHIPVTAAQAIPPGVYRPYVLQTPTPRPQSPIPIPTVSSLPGRYPVKGPTQPSFTIPSSHPYTSTISPTPTPRLVHLPVKGPAQPSPTSQSSQPSTPTISPSAKSPPVRGPAQPSNIVQSEPLQPPSPSPKTGEVEPITTSTESMEKNEVERQDIDQDMTDHGEASASEIGRTYDTLTPETPGSSYAPKIDIDKDPTPEVKANMVSEEVIYVQVQEKEPLSEEESTSKSEDVKKVLDVNALFDV